MPNCRNCGTRISKFDADICPVCGTKKPLEGVNSETIEITSQIDLNDFKEGQKVVRRHKVLLLLFIIVGFTGAPFFYLKKKKNAFIWLFANLVFLGALFCILYFAASLGIVLSIIIPVAAVYLVSVITGLVYHYTPNLKDGEGEFVV